MFSEGILEALEGLLKSTSFQVSEVFEEVEVYMEVQIFGT